MTLPLRAYALFIAAAAVAGVALAADSGPGRGSGWTGVTNPKDVIMARQELMEHIEILMEPIDTITVKDGGDPERLRANAEAVSAMLLALPHLFPPTTDLYDPKAEFPATLALPTIWKDFGTFYRLAGAAAKAAEAMENAKGKEPMRAASRQLRGSCDACHTLFLRRYLPPKVLDSDLKFDFNKALRKP